MEFFYI